MVELQTLVIVFSFTGVLGSRYQVLMLLDNRLTPRTIIKPPEPSFLRNNSWRKGKEKALWDASVEYLKNMKQCRNRASAAGVSALCLPE